jgi:uncharacterized protein
MYIRRGIQQASGAFTQAPVTILEGRRAVGKTALVRHLLDVGAYASYSDLTDEMTLTRAEADLSGWLASLARPAVIDEAQLIPELATTIKRIIDSTGPAAHQFLLTGSSVVGRGTMGGSDPLAGRSARLMLHPFTGGELAEPSEALPSLVDLLFNGPLDPQETPLTNPSPSSERQALIRDLRQGGIPAYCLPDQRTTTARLNARVQADITSLLGDRIVPGESFDGARAQRILDAVVRAPGGILNKSRLAGDLGIDVRTLTAYLDVLERRFLLTQLHNAASGPSGASRTRPKVHPSDTSLACESLARAGHDVAQSPELLGQVLESWVVQQVIAARGWSRLHADAFYWRDPKTEAEVDLTLIDGEGRVVGIEVKSAQSVTGRDLRGLGAMQSSRTGLHRGFIVYTGRDLVSMAPGIWALPIELIRDPNGWPGRSPAPRLATRPKETAVDITNQSDVDASLFLSYVHSDDAYLGGAITAFADEVCSSYRFLTGRTIELFIDRRDIRWGEAWQQRIARQLADSSFLLAMVTPSYIRSQACRDEVMEFQASDPERQRLLALMVREPDAQAHDVRDNPAVTQVMREIDAHQYLKPDQALEDLGVGTPPFKKTALLVAERLRDAVALDRTQPSELVVRPKGESPGDEDGLMEVLDDLQEFTMPALIEEMATFRQALESFGANVQGAFPTGAPATQGTIVLAAARLEPDRTLLEVATAHLTETWERFNGAMLQVVRLSKDPSVQSFAPGLLAEFRDARIDLNESELQQMRYQLQGLSKLSKAWRPSIQAFGRALDALLTIKRGVEAWAE